MTPLSINPEPFGCALSLEPLGPEFVAEELVERYIPGLWFGRLTIPSGVEGQTGESKD